MNEFKLRGQGARRRKLLAEEVLHGLDVVICLALDFLHPPDRGFPDDFRERVESGRERCR